MKPTLTLLTALLLAFALSGNGRTKPRPGVVRKKSTACLVDVGG